MKQQAEFYPLDSRFKSPVGAVKVNEKTRFNLRFTRPQNPEDVFLCLTKDGEEEVRYPMSFSSQEPDGTFEYTADITVTSRGLYFYHFLVLTNSEQIHIGCNEDLTAMLGRGQDWQLTVIGGEPVSKWLQGGIMYQIMVDRFFTGGDRLKTKDMLYRDDWGGVPEYKPTADGKILNKDLFGGNLMGVTKKLAYLSSLGVNCIYLNPIFEAHSNHKYDTAHYRRIDSDFGTADDLRELIKKAAKKGIKIILDGVFSHTGDNSIYFNKYQKYDSVGAYQSEESPYRSWYSFSDFSKREYDSWWGIDILPNTVEEDASFDEYINGEDGIIRYWSEFGLGGWRLDVVDELPDKFLDRLSKTAKNCNPDALILGEVWEDASNKISYSKRRRYLQGGQLDSVTNYPFKEDILHFVKTGDSAALSRTINVLINNYPKDVLDNLMNILGTHDTQRLLTTLDGSSPQSLTREQKANAKLKDFDTAFARLKLATKLQYTLPGVPCVYYGDEAGLEGYEDPFNRRCYPWGNANPAILRWYKKLGSMRKLNSDVLADGEFKTILSDNGVFVFSRTKGKNYLITVINTSTKDYKFPTDNKSYTDLITLKPFSGTVKPLMGAVIRLSESTNLPPAKVKKKP